MPKKYTILITGSSGMLGVDLCRELKAEYKLYGMDMVHSPWSIVHSFTKGDITDRREMQRILKKIKPDLVIHAAAWTDVDGCEADKKKAYLINVNGTKNVARACFETGAIPIYISTDFVFNGHKKAPYTETDKPDPLSVYGESKLAGEEAVRRSTRNHFILRTSWLYGKHCKNFVDTILAKAKAGGALRVVDDQVGSPTYAKDLAKAIHALLDRNQRPETGNQGYGIYHVSNSGSVSWY